MKPLLKNTASRQRGAVLVVSLIMLAVMTLFVISMLKTSVIELKIGGASHVAALNFANAEVAIDNFIAVNNGRFAPRFAEVGCVINCVITTPPTVEGGTVLITVTQVNCGAADPKSLQPVQFDVLAAATGTLGGTVTVHQGVQTLATANSC